MASERWEYRVEDLKYGFLGRAMQAEALTETLNRQGAQGWELVNVVMYGAQMKAFFKRQR